MRPYLLPLLSLLVACPDPSATPQGLPGGPGAPGAPGPGGPGPGAPGPATPAKDWNTHTGASVTLSGELSYAGSKKGTLRLDFLGANNLAGLQHTMTVDAVGPWSVKAPAELGDVYIVGFVDVDGDGPSATDPAARTADPISIGKEDIGGLNLTLSDTPELGDLTPGGPHPGAIVQPPTGGEAPPQAGGPPPGGDGGHPPGGDGGPPPGGSGGPPAGADGGPPPAGAPAGEPPSAPTPAPPG